MTDDITERAIGCAFAVHRKLGPGFLEKVYENALVIELNKAGLNCRQQAPIAVLYDGQQVGEYYADILVNDCVICELKAGDALDARHEAQLVNYLVATGMETGLLLHFGRSVTVKRKFRDYKKPAGSEESCQS